MARTLRDILRESSRLAVLTGAGISAESGIPTFRSPDGIWAKFKPEELANINAFMANPERVWEWYDHRRSIVNKAKPNPGHYALVRMEKFFDRVDIITQNVDGLHQRAGSTHVDELHGSLNEHRCFDCGAPHEISDEESSVPHCARCGGLIRPGVVWFGEELPQDVWKRSEEVVREADLFITVGTSAVVYPAASLPLIALAEGAIVLEVNPERTDFTSRAHLFLQGPAGEHLPKIVTLLEEIRAS